MRSGLTGVAAGLVCAAQVPIWIGATVCLRLEQRLAREVGRNDAVFLTSEEGNVLLGRTARQRLEPVRKVTADDDSTWRTYQDV